MHLGKGRICDFDLDFLFISVYILQVLWFYYYAYAMQYLFGNPFKQK